MSLELPEPDRTGRGLPGPGTAGGLTRIPLLGLALLAAAAAAAAAAVGVASGLRSSLALLLVVVAASVLPVIVQRPRLVLCGLVVLTVSGGSAQIATLGVPRPYFLALLVAVMTAVIGLRAGRLHLPAGRVLQWTAALLAVQVLPAAVADDSALAAAAVQDLFIGAAGLAVVAVLASNGGLPTLVSSAVATAAGLATLTVVHALLLPDRVDLLGFSQQQAAALGSAVPRYAGPIGDANFWGRDLVLYLLLALGCALAAGPGRRRAACSCAFLVLGVAVLLTGSRGTFLAAAVAVALWLFTAGPRTRRLLWLAPAVLVLLLAVPGVGSRLASLTGPQTASGSDPSLVGRQNALGYAVSMFLDHPLLGVGPGNFIAEVPTYQRRSGDTSDPIAPHNLYAQQAAEAGAPGLLVWLGLLTSAALTALAGVRAARAGPGRSSGAGGEERGTALPAALPAALLAALCGWAVAGLFLHLASFDALALVLVAVMLSTPTSPQARPVVPVRRPMTSGHLVVVFVAAEVLLAALLVLPWRETVHVGQFTVAVTTIGQAPTPYLLDVRNRPEVVATFAQILRSGTSDTGTRPGADTSRSVLVAAGSTVIMVVVRSPASSAAADSTYAAFDGALRLGVQADAEYALAPAAGAPRLRAVREVQPAVLGAALGLSLLSGAAAARLLVQRRPAARPR